MKTKNLLNLLLIIAVIGFTPIVTKAQTIGKPDGNTLNFFSTNFFGKLLGHSEAGSFGSFASSAQWIGIGQPVVSPFSSTKVPAYGLRSQWSGQAGIFSLKGSGSVKDLVVEWGSNTASKLRFSFISDLNNPSALTEVMTMASDGKIGVGVVNPTSTLDLNTNAASSSFSSTNAIINTLTGSSYSMYGLSNRLNNISAYGTVALESRITGTAQYMTAGSFRATNSSVSTNPFTYGISASASGPGPNVWAGYFSGNVFISGALTVASDKKFKEDINELSKSTTLSKLMKLEPRTYYYKKDDQVNFDEGLQYGFLAQDVEEIFPALVKDVRQPVYNGTDEFGNPKIDENNFIEFKSVNYIGMIPILTKALQDQEAVIADLSRKNEELVEKFSQLLTAIESNNGDLLRDVIETSKTSLGQNQPNPFGQSTEITYSLAASVQKASIQIYNLDGKLLGDYNLDKDQKSLQLKANAYEPGVYVYVMIADGKTVATRRMIVSE